MELYVREGLAHRRVLYGCTHGLLAVSLMAVASISCYSYWQDGVPKLFVLLSLSRFKSIIRKTGGVGERVL